jgi:D-3-phosphoglycerate dehydrogenase / 2-oxoglutarate reductase
MLVLIADKLPDAGLEALAALGVRVEARPQLTAETLPAALRETGAGVLVVRSTKVTSAAIEAGSALSLIIRAGAGVNTIDLGAASRHGVFVSNCPGKNAIAVAELTMGLILALDRQLPEAIGDMRAGRWRKKTYGKGLGLFGRTLGIVGFGAIAREVASRARGFGLEVLVFSRSLTDALAEQHDVLRAPELGELLRRSDIVSLHVPYSKQTHHLIDAAALESMKDGALLIHTARGGVVDDDALAKAVAAGHVRAALDVFEDEPAGAEAEFRSPLLELPGVYGTPHIGASTDQAQLATVDEVVRIVATYLQTGAVPNCCNLEPPRPACWTVVVRHRDRVGVLASVLAALREENLNVQEMQNVIFAGSEAASATITLEREPSRTLLENLRAQDDILAVDIRATG